MGYVEGISRDQIMMVDLESLIPEESECRVIDAFCEKLDTKKMGFKHSKEPSRNKLCNLGAE